MKYFLGVDVGSESVRAALVDGEGVIHKTSVSPIAIWNPQPNFYQQSSDNIWDACCTTIKNVISEINPNSVYGIGFDATCSLVVLNSQNEPTPVSVSGDSCQNVIMWMDHRAGEQAESINKTNHSVLKYLGGKISLEMQPPKLLWLKQNMSNEWWQNVRHFMDLPDFLTWKATSSTDRSLCSLVCKWTYQADETGSQGWDSSFWTQIGLKELLKNNYELIGNVVLPPGSSCGKGLSKQAASELGLREGLAVSASIIDAHAGGVGLLSTQVNSSIPEQLSNRLAVISGTSNCLMTVSEGPVFVKGVWGPYYSVILPGLWTNEGGQSAAGKLVDHIISTHPAYQSIKARLNTDRNIYQELNSILSAMQKDLTSVQLLTENLHVWPDFHGNRSPLADVSLKGMISGLSLNVGEQELACLYLATLQALAYGTKHILEAMQSSGHHISCILICGGLSKNPLFIQTYADATGLPVIKPSEEESMLLGSAILGALASGEFASIGDAMTAMGSRGVSVQPEFQTQQFHSRKYKVFLQMVTDQKNYERIMKI